MSDQKQFLVAGATLECPYGSRISKLLPGGKSDALSIGKKLFLSVNAAEKGKNIAGFEKCQSEYCKGQPCDLLSVKLDAPAPCRLVASDLAFA